VRGGAIAVVAWGPRVDQRRRGRRRESGGEVGTDEHDHLELRSSSAALPECHVTWWRLGGAGQS
jgi:hypothetical protein